MTAMTTDGESLARQSLTFGRYMLDLNRGCLLLDGREIPLRPKTFAVLCYPVQHPGRLIGKEELLQAVWPNLVVTDDTLVQSIGELHGVLGEAGARMVVTQPNGYRFEAAGAPRDRRQRHGRWLRWHWMYGILAPLALLLTFVVMWLGMRGCAAP
jgi:DNA-binding winged helix-turn-helix (wHTH) protein